MRIGYYSALNRPKYNINNGQLKFKQTLTNLGKKNLANSSTYNMFTEQGKKFLTTRKHLSEITEVSGNKVGKLAANNNVLNLKEGSFYKMQISSGTTAIFTVNDNSNVYMPFSKLGINDPESVAPADYQEISKTSRLLSSLASDSSAFNVRTGGYSKTEIKEILNNIGIKPGWFEVNTNEQSNKFYLVDNGLIYPEYQVEAERNAFNKRNWFEDGYTTNSVFTIEGKDYKLDENGHLNIPEGVGCLMDTTKIVK